MITPTANSSRRLPAEWEPQDGILLAWPHNNSDWQPILDQIIPVFVELTRQISRFEKVLIAAPNPTEVSEALRTANIPLGQISIYPIPTNDTWRRDFGPLTILDNNKPLLLNFDFNGWGLKFNADLDNQVNSRLQQAGAFGENRFESCNLTLEGGSIESDGCGTIMTTDECLLKAKRNPHLSKEQIETELKTLLGVRRFLWLGHGYLSGDDTDSHIDTLARLCPDETIVYVKCDDPQDEHYPALQRMENQLKQFRTAQQKLYRLIPLPWPQTCYDEEKQRLPVTYANYLVINGAVLVPTYADQADAIALDTINQAYPDREIIGVDCRPVIKQHGSLHCLCMQLPQGVLP